MEGREGLVFLWFKSMDRGLLPLEKCAGGVYASGAGRWGVGRRGYLNIKWKVALKCLGPIKETGPLPWFVSRGRRNYCVHPL